MKFNVYIDVASNIGVAKNIPIIGNPIEALSLSDAMRKIADSLSERAGLLEITGMRVELYNEEIK